MLAGQEMFTSGPGISLMNHMRHVIGKTVYRAHFPLLYYENMQRINEPQIITCGIVKLDLIDLHDKVLKKMLDITQKICGLTPKRHGYRIPHDYCSKFKMMILMLKQDPGLVYGANMD